MKNWARFAVTVGAIGWLVGYFGNFGPNGAGIGALTGVLVATLLPWILFFLGSHDRVERTEQEKQERLRRRAAARRRTRERNQIRRVMFLSAAVVGYLSGAAWYRSFTYDGWFTWIITADLLIMVVVPFASDPDEPWPIPWPGED